MEVLSAPPAKQRRRSWVRANQKHRERERERELVGRAEAHVANLNTTFIHSNGAFTLDVKSVFK